MPRDNIGLRAPLSLGGPARLAPAPCRPPSGRAPHGERAKTVLAQPFSCLTARQQSAASAEYRARTRLIAAQRTRLIAAQRTRLRPRRRLLRLLGLRPAEQRPVSAMHAQSRPRVGCRGGRDQDKMRTNETERGAGRGVWNIFRFISRIGSVMRSLLVVLPFAPHPSETRHSVNHPTRQVIYSKHPTRQVIYSKHPARQVVYKDHRHFEDQATPVQRKEEVQATPAPSAEDQETLRALSARASIPRGSAKQQRPGRSRPARRPQPGERGPRKIMAPQCIGTVE